ncbi:RELT-like protein 2 [Melanotaenia boesemani]|uniref:RELT-like protein 2 n=1 Tax=Melanotaenia boesemani TaxID=1250792 RepID=UPI001C053ECA|nr:RELT-like protein 2 [Melanotaenia boesemani]XP_041847201.1 RELT-like protein 2 [Melanotaenia boesemani]
MTELEASGVGEPPPPYMIFLVVFLFFLTGLLGFLICHLLKKKGYRCRAGDMDDEKEEEKLREDADEEDEENQDTVEQILKCIIENEANMEAFNEMLGNRNVCERHDPRLRKESIGGVPPHLHTVHSGTDHNSCLLCAQVRSKKGHRHSRTPRFKQRPGEQTVFSVGRFRVTHTDKKPRGAVSRDHLDQSQDSEERKDGEYNLRNMFKDVPSESANGVAANVGKRKKSVTIFGLRRGSDPIGIKVKEVTGREAGGIRFAIQQPSIVVEEPLQTENIEADPKPGSRPETEPKQTQFDLSPGPESETKLKSSTGSTVGSAPSCLPGSSEKTVNVDDKVLKIDELSNLGPQQTSTPITPMPPSRSGFTPDTGPSEPHSNKRFPVTQTPPDPSSSPDLEPGFGAGLALISLGSSPPPSFPNKTLSSVSSLKTPTLSPAESPSPKSSSRNKQSEETEAALTTNSKLLPDLEKSSPSPDPALSLGQSASPLLSQSPCLDAIANPSPPPTSSSSPADQNLSFISSHHSTQRSTNVTSEPSMTKEDVASSLSMQEETISKTEEKKEIKRAGNLKITTLGEPKAFHLSSASHQLSKDTLSSFPPSSSPQSSSSPEGSRISSVMIVKASPDSKREFSVITMVEEEAETNKHTFKLEKAEISPVEGGDVCPPGVRRSQGQSSDSSVTEVMMEIEDIRDCKVEQVEGTKRLEEEGESTQTGSLLQ